MIWTDCDREGEHIGSEIVSVCRRANRNIRVKRAKFSAIIAAYVTCLISGDFRLGLRGFKSIDKFTMHAETPLNSTCAKQRPSRFGSRLISGLVQLLHGFRRWVFRTVCPNWSKRLSAMVSHRFYPALRSQMTDCCDAAQILDRPLSIPDSRVCRGPVRTCAGVHTRNFLVHPHRAAKA